MKLKTVLGLLLAAAAMTASADSFFAEGKIIPIKHKGMDTYYINGHIDGVGPLELLVDTGSGYSTINEETLDALDRQGRAHYLRKLKGVMADGSHKIVPVYRISGINIGGECMVDDIEVVIFPGKTRAILGMNTLRKVSPFMFSVEPPSLALSNCS